jgi:cytochrome c biogenesis protein CcdA
MTKHLSTTNPHPSPRKPHPSTPPEPTTPEQTTSERITPPPPPPPPSPYVHVLLYILAGLLAVASNPTTAVLESVLGTITVVVVHESIPTVHSARRRLLISICAGIGISAVFCVLKHPEIILT